MAAAFFEKVDLEDRSVKVAALGLALYGAYQVARGVGRASYSMLKYFVLPRKDLAFRYGKGAWVLATGGADGLGKQYCCQLASEGFNIIIMDINADKMM